MTKIRLLVLACAVTGFTTNAFADDPCAAIPGGPARANAQVKQAQELERAGKFREAHAAARKVGLDCAHHADGLGAVLKRTATAIGSEEEKKARFQEAFDWYQSAGSSADSARMQRKLVQTKPEDTNVIRVAIDFFKRAGDSASEKETRAIALKNLERALADEEKNFNGVAGDTLSDLGRARDWARYAGSGEDRAVARAEKRGTSLSAEDGHLFLEHALKYYTFTGNKAKEQTVREKARRLADRAAGKRENELAAKYFFIAGDKEKGKSLEKQAAQQSAQTEQARRGKFQKEQDDLEKQLNMK